MIPAASLRLPSPLGDLLLTASPDALTGLWMLNGPRGAGPPPAPEDPGRAVLRAAQSQLEAYFAGRLQRFDLPLAPAGTPFQQAVWTLLAAIPYGTTTTYGALAARLGKPGASRAVGLANGQNPISIILPCHRVIGTDGTLTGYGGGLGRKRWLLAHEQAAVAKGGGRLL
ncbi:MAG TPA: methylated-DNA--[protein]-cysteine S-methyltransferase [Geminicoccaceae bacterium]|nr:methylated-DNA--[protein]-cysteine S-methyltransferase [Geminicoccaceae bacterium]